MLFQMSARIFWLLRKRKPFVISDECQDLNYFLVATNDCARKCRNYFLVATNNWRKSVMLLQMSVILRLARKCRNYFLVMILQMKFGLKIPELLSQIYLLLQALSCLLSTCRGSMRKEKKRFSNITTKSVHTF